MQFCAGRNKCVSVFPGNSHDRVSFHVVSFPLRFTQNYKCSSARPGAEHLSKMPDLDLSEPMSNQPMASSSTNMERESWKKTQRNMHFLWSFSILNLLVFFECLFPLQSPASLIKLTRVLPHAWWVALIACLLLTMWGGRQSEGNARFWP